MRHVGKILDENRGMGPGFGLARIGLAITIIAWHSLVVSQGDRSIFDLKYTWSLNYALLPMFFGLSGFLIAGSAVRLRMRDFFLNRAARIFPALAVETVLSAVLIGFLVTDLSIGQYFTDPAFFTYFRNMYGAVVYELPGVHFLAPYPNIVNGVIWTVPIELACYVVMGVVMAVKLQKQPYWLIAIGLALLYVPYAIDAFHLQKVGQFIDASNHLSFLKNLRGETLLPSFLFGIAAYHLRYRVPVSVWSIAGASAIIVSLGCVGTVTEAFAHFWVPMVMCVAAVLLVVQIGCLDLRRMTPKGDYSYGLYIYCFPIQQIVNREMHISGIAGFAFNFLASLAIAFGFAFFSWHVIEKPVLQLRKRFAVTRTEPAVAAPS